LRDRNGRITRGEYEATCAFGQINLMTFEEINENRVALIAENQNDREKL